MLKVKTASGQDIPLFDSSSPTFDDSGIGTSTNYANFLIQRLNEQRVEKQQIIETFGEDYVYFFGERPRFLEVSGQLINTADFNWKSEFWANYDQNLRGTKLVERNARVYFYFDDVVAEGYIVNAATGADAQQPHMLGFQFQFFVTNYAILSNVGSVFFGPSDSNAFLSGTGVQVTGLEPFTLVARKAAAAAAAQQGSPGGLTGFLATVSSLKNDASFSIQSTLQNLQDALYGRAIVLPNGLGSQVVVPPIDNQAVFTPAPTGQPIYTMYDEYPERSPPPLDPKLQAASDAETARVNGILALQTPVALEAKARKELAARGVDTTNTSTTMALLGRGAFAAIQYAAPFALSKAGGGLDIATQASNVIIS